MKFISQLYIILVFGIFIQACDSEKELSAEEQQEAIEFEQEIEKLERRTKR